MNHNSTNYPLELTHILKQCYESSEYKDTLRYYQILANCFFENSLRKGLYLWFVQGSGKTLALFHILENALKTTKYKKAIIVSPRTLIKNLKDSVIKYKEITGHSVNVDKIGYVKNSSTVLNQIAFHDDEREIDPFNMDKKAEKIASLKSLDDYIIVFEEAHIFSRRIINGSESSVQLYDLIMKSNCKCLFMSGSLMAARPFESAPLMNMCSGEFIMPEYEEDFNSLFVDREGDKPTIKNREIFQDRAYGMFSRIKSEYFTTDDLSNFPHEYPVKIMELPMTKKQQISYMIIRSKEMVEDKSRNIFKKKSSSAVRFASNKNESGSYRVRSRQYCNATASENIEAMFKKGNYDQKDIITEVFKTSKTELESNKIIEFKKIHKERPKQKFLIYSQFVGFGGAASIAAYLVKDGWTEIDANLSDITSYDGLLKDELSAIPKNGLRFARVNGSLTEEEQGRIVDYFVDPDNDDAKHLAGLIIGYEQCMGLDLVTVRYTIMWESYFLDYIREQLNYRMNRFKSHTRLPKDQQNVQMYIFISVYAKDTEMDRLPEDMKETTDQFMYELMTNNKTLLDDFKSAIDEVSIECSLVKQFNPELHHTCRVCNPDGAQLYTETDIDKTTGKIRNPTSTINYDIKNGTNCQEQKKKEVKVNEIKVTINGEQVTYYYTKDDSSNIVIYFETNDGSYMKVPEESDVYVEITKKIK